MSIKNLYIKERYADIDRDYIYLSDDARWLLNRCKKLERIKTLFNDITNVLVEEGLPAGQKYKDFAKDILGDNENE